MANRTRYLSGIGCFHPVSERMVGEELVKAVVPRGLTALAAHLTTVSDHNCPIRMDDYHMNMALGIILDPQAHLKALADAGVDLAILGRK